MKKVFCVFKIDYVVVESVAVDSPVAHTVAISVDSVDRIMQNLRYLCALVNTQSDEGIDSQFRIERFVRLQDDSFSGTRSVLILSTKFGKMSRMALSISW